MRFHFPGHHHRRRLPLGEHLRPQHPRPRRGDREGRAGGARRHQLRRPDLVRAAAIARLRLHPVDRRRGTGARAGPDPRQAARLRHARFATATPRSRSSCTARRAPRATFRTTCCASCTASSTCSRTRRSSSPATSSARRKRLSRLAAAAVLPRADALRRRRLVFLALPRPLGRRRLPEEPGRPDVPPVLRREHAARRRLQRRRGTRPVARPHRPGRRFRAQCGAHLQRRPPVLRHQRHVDLEQDRLAFDGGAGRHRRRQPQLPQVDPARDHDDRRHPGVPDADAQQLRHHRPDPEERVRLGQYP